MINAHAVIHFLLLFLALGKTLQAVDSEISIPLLWKPFEHPAKVKRSIIGFTSPSRNYDVISEFEGRVDMVYADAGDEIKAEKNDTKTVIVTLDTYFTILQRDQARVLHELALSRVEQKSLQCDIAIRQAMYQRREVQRIEELVKSGRVAETVFDASVLARDSAELLSREAEVALKIEKISVERARYAINGAQEQVKRHTIYAPAKWMVVERLVEPGEYVQKGEIILRLAYTKELALNLQLSEKEIQEIQSKRSIPIHFPHNHIPTVEARIHHISVDYDRDTNKRLVEFRFSGVVTSGVEANLTFTIPDPNDLVIIPRSFLLSRPDQDSVILESKEEIIVTPVREEGNFVLVPRELFSEHTILIMPTSP